MNEISVSPQEKGNMTPVRQARREAIDKHIKAYKILKGGGEEPFSPNTGNEIWEQGKKNIRQAGVEARVSAHQDAYSVYITKIDQSLHKPENLQPYSREILQKVSTHLQEQRSSIEREVTVRAQASEASHQPAKQIDPENRLSGLDTNILIFSDMLYDITTDDEKNEILCGLGVINENMTVDMIDKFQEVASRRDAYDKGLNAYRIKNPDGIVDSYLNLGKGVIFESSKNQRGERNARLEFTYPAVNSVKPKS